MARNQRTYDNEYKAQAVKLAQEIGGYKAASESEISDGTIYCWIKAFKEGRLEAKPAVHTPNNALSLNEELIELRKRMKEQDKEIRRLKEENEFPEEASTFFVASRRKSAKKQRLMFIAIKTEDGIMKGKISFYCRMLDVSRQAFNKYLKTKDHPWKYQSTGFLNNLIQGGTVRIDLINQHFHRHSNLENARELAQKF